ncbi:MAG: cation:proton antiporter [Thermoplasmata archaeon]|nr:cation:proton antiporter [Thermoplasmata archaeon]
MYSVVYLLLLLIAAIFFGKIADRLKQPTIVGNIIGGIVFGPVLVALFKVSGISILGETAINLHPEKVEEEIAFLMELSIIMLMFASGLETRIKDFIASFNTGIITAGLGVIVPFGLGFLVSYLYFDDIVVALYIGAALSITAVALSVTTLIQMDAIQTRFGMTIINAAIVDDIIGIILLSIILSISRTGELPGILDVGGTILLAVTFVAVALFLMPRVLKRMWSYFREARVAEKIPLTVLMAALFAVIAHVMGLHLMIGAFLGGMAIRGSLSKRTKESIERWSFGFFGPLFFAWVGFSITFSGAVVSVFMPIILIMAFVGKLFGSGLGAKISGLSWPESTLVGVGMNGKAAVELILAAVALKAGIIDRDLYSAVVLMAAILALTTPVLLKTLHRKFQNKGWIGDG